MSDSPIIKLIPDGIGDVAKAAALPLAHRIGNTIESLWYLAFGGIESAAEKRKIKVAVQLAQFKDELEERLQAVPAENLAEPSFQVVGQALENVKYCIEEPTLREMFANLIAKSVDLKYQASVHPAFASIIAQMSPLDADNLRLFEAKPNTYLPIVEYRYILHPNAYRSANTNIFLENPNVHDLAAQSASISSLERLGLVRISYDSYLTDPGEYDKFSEINIYKNLFRFISKPSSNVWTSPDDDGKIMRVDVQKGSVGTTSFGAKFMSVVL